MLKAQMSKSTRKLVLPDVRHFSSPKLSGKALIRKSNQDLSRITGRIKTIFNLAKVQYMAQLQRLSTLLLSNKMCNAQTEKLSHTLIIEPLSFSASPKLVRKHIINLNLS